MQCDQTQGESSGSMVRARAKIPQPLRNTSHRVVVRLLITRTASSTLANYIAQWFRHDPNLHSREQVNLTEAKDFAEVAISPPAPRQTITKAFPKRIHPGRGSPDRYPGSKKEEDTKYLSPESGFSEGADVFKAGFFGKKDYITRNVLFFFPPSLTKRLRQ
ncbi:hypothetical protein CDAR_393611 [Caerostris darwini]|uniref:Uncharacterized protein n=1 Tax=Caerostris darwini TaxID=1538125 RepID=A0AAV4W9X5_9ARAC|nr:hypothetical protein CDAR_393611 [Caerostris darwini]